jgi:hypothetical protein
MQYKEMINVSQNIYQLLAIKLNPLLLNFQQSQ